MNSLAFDTLKLAQRLEAAGLAPKMAQEVAGAIAETAGEAGVTREQLDLGLSDLRVELDLRLGEIRGKLNELQGEQRLLLGAIALQTLVILAGVAILLRLLS
ncbi:MAG: hypothetical protein ACM3JG_19370 [Thiohalocapsa sp.]